eukprot:CAMPEP_0177692474 /NCGR_PEP_ID=MMETSP0484_2-20121128/1871_1 /TAXON_ID=354590 /ORGANISM="Rhodomonas lens, Strain RHODO" /LENGTH=186 /DNA_ID=CAMNT_0019203191 /DNA_START=20 /DNA_END=577 /DNA_ORIENTATION=+
MRTLTCVVLFALLGLTCAIPSGVVFQAGALATLQRASQRASGSFRKHSMTALLAGKKSFKDGAKGWGGPGGYLETVEFGGRKTLMQVFDTVLAIFVFSALACDKNVLRFVVGECSFKECVVGMVSDQKAAYSQKAKEVGQWIQHRNELAQQRAEEKRQEELKAKPVPAPSGNGEYPPGSLGNPLYP